MLKLIYPPRHYFFDSGGKPLIGGYIEYDDLIYQDVFKTVPRQKRILLDEHGSALLYFDDDININIYNRHGDFIETQIIPAQPEWVFFYDKFGKPLKHGKVWVYRFRSTILKDSFAIDDKSVINTNPVLLDDDGKAKIYIDGAYRLKVYNANDVLMHDVDVYQLSAPMRFDYFLQSLKYPKFKKKSLVLTSRKYPIFKRVELVLSSLHYPKFVKQNLMLSSLLYPYIDGDSLMIQAGFDSGQMLPMPIEIMQIGADFVGGETRSILKVHHQPLEDILKIGSDFVGGEMRSILKTHHQPLEDILSVSSNFVGGELRRILISYHAPVEDVLNVSADFVGGELKWVKR